jgi:isopenicillin-N N-acyltransferase-like protein
VTVATYRRLFSEAAGLGRDDVLRAGESVGVSLAWPDLVEEIEGIAAGAGVDARELVAINARTELLAGTQGECSLLARVERDGAGAWLAQTWDWHPGQARAVIAWTVEHVGGRFTTITEAGILAKLGENTSGVACGLNYLACSADRRCDGAPVHVLLRLVLERCEDATDARALLRSVPTAASSCITVATSGGELFAAELSPGGAQLIGPAPDGWLAHTNHFLREPSVGTDAIAAAHPGTLERRARLLSGARSGLAPQAALAQHEAVFEPICRHDSRADEWHERRATLLAVWARPGREALRVADGPPCRAGFVALPASAGAVA